MLYNLHTHHPVLTPGIFEIESVYFGQEKKPVSPRISAGLHPWHLNGVDWTQAEQWLREQAAGPATVAIGEAGFDKVVATPWDVQMTAFQLCFKISEEYNKPLILHCVRAFDELLALKKTWKPAQAWIFHGFEKNAETARMLLHAGCYLSFGAALFREKSRVAEALRQTPANRLFLETDATDFSIEKVYQRAAELRGETPEKLAAQMAENMAALFG